jgi:tetratricopeptide (TPR) repeat protein
MFHFYFKNISFVIKIAKTTYISAQRDILVNFRDFPLLIGLIVTICFSASFGYTQNQVEINQKYLQAQQFEMQGEFEEALALYKEIYRIQPDNPNYFFKVRLMLENLKQYKEWITCIDDGLKRRPKDISLVGERARALYLMGEESEAKKTLDSIIAEDPQSEDVYRIVMQIQQILRDYDGATATLLLGRKNLKNTKIFASELGNLYQIRQEYKSAVLEYLNLASTNPAYFPIAEQMIYNFPSDSDVIADITDALEQFTPDSKNNVNFCSLLSGFYTRNCQYQKAFESYILLDSLSRTNGGYVMSYADQVYYSGAYYFAIAGYRYVIEHFPMSPILGNAQFGLARSYEAASETAQDENSQSLLAQAIAEYTDISRIYKETPWEFEAFYRIGSIKFRRQFDIDGAITAYETVRTRSPQTMIRWESVIALGDCYRAQGNLEKSVSYYSEVETAPGQFEPLKQKARFNLLRNTYYSGDFSTIQQKLNSFLVQISTSSELCNDILAFALFLDQNITQDNEPLKQYAHSELLIEQHKLSEAEAFLRQTAAKNPDHPIADDVLYKIAEILKDMGRYSESIETYTALLQRYPSSLLGERALIAIGTLYEGPLHQSDAAIKEYEKFLQQYPNSIFIDMVRNQIRKLKQIK